jgi:hypothetical protein
MDQLVGIELPSLRADSRTAKLCTTAAPRTPAQYIYKRDKKSTRSSAGFILARLHLEQPGPASAGADLPPSVGTRASRRLVACARPLRGPGPRSAVKRLAGSCTQPAVVDAFQHSAGLSIVRPSSRRVSCDA